MVTRNMFGSRVPAKPGQARTTRNWRTYRLRTLVKKRTQRLRPEEKKIFEYIMVKVTVCIPISQMYQNNSKGPANKG